MIKLAKSISIGIVMAMSILLGMTGCKREPSLVGTWVADPFTRDNKSILTFTFRRDGKYEDSLNTEPNHNAYFNRATSSGTYKLDGRRLRITITSYHRESVNHDGSIRGRSKPTETYTMAYAIAWKDTNHVTLFPTAVDDYPLTLTRQTTP